MIGHGPAVVIGRIARQLLGARGFLLRLELNDQVAAVLDLELGFGLIELDDDVVLLHRAALFGEPLDRRSTFDFAAHLSCIERLEGAALGERDLEISLAHDERAPLRRAELGRFVEDSRLPQCGAAAAENQQSNDGEFHSSNLPDSSTKSRPSCRRRVRRAISWSTMRSS